jgi:hypothetical protein
VSGGLGGEVAAEVRAVRAGNRPAKERFAVFREANGRVLVFKDRAVRQHTGLEPRMHADKTLMS